MSHIFQALSIIINISVININYNSRIEFTTTLIIHGCGVCGRPQGGGGCPDADRCGQGGGGSKSADFLRTSFVHDPLPMELLYTDDLVLVAETEELLMEKLRKWKRGMELKGLRVNIGKTKVMKCQVRIG